MKLNRLLYALVLLTVVACTATAGPTTAGPTTNSGPGASGHTVPVDSAGMPLWGHQTKTSGCQVNGVYPDPACTPGAILPNVTAAQVCKSGYATSVRNVPESEKNAVYKEYGSVHHVEKFFDV